jgi:hypothetical protein
VNKARIGTVGGLGCFLVAAVCLAVSVDARQYTPLSDPERKSCIAAGGQVAVMGLSGTEGCVRPMPDAGKACTDGRQCQASSCILDAKAPGFKPPGANEAVTGICAPTDFGFGCAWRVFDGRAMLMCVD